ncbi:MAG: tetratricopeptide repeat protein [Endomicrobium sp.]|jgi:tetratricopeptide (TPR) repeat protein|nr:tetratricopeptide repeat protein [Endomicrobium sp.]
MKKFLGLCFIVFISALLSFADDSSVLNQISNAETAFKNGDYNRTVEIYETLIQVEKINNPSFYYNLSNAYYRRGDIGRALLNIEKAYKLSPRDKDIKDNMQYLLTMTGQNANTDLIESAVNLFSLNEITAAASVIMILFLLSASAFLFFRRQFIKKIFSLLLILSILSCSLTALKAFSALKDKAVVLNASILKSGPKEDNADIFNIPAAKIITVLSAVDDWSRISFKDNETAVDGWLENNKIGKF